MASLAKFALSLKASLLDTIIAYCIFAAKSSASVAVAAIDTAIDIYSSVNSPKVFSSIV
jgi:hypothetical protein